MGEKQHKNQGCNAQMEYNSGHLPPLDAWRVNPMRLQKFFAPTDDRGFVLPDATIEVVKGLIDDEYEWPIDTNVQQLRPDVHHFHWMARQYDSQYFQGRTTPSRFRESPALKGVLPRQFHNLIHFATLPPSMPKYKHMEQHLQALYLARRLFESAEKAMEAQAMFVLRGDKEDDEIAQQIMATRFDRHFRGYRNTIEQMLGSETLEVLKLDDPKFCKRKPHEITKSLGHLAKVKAINYVPTFRVQSLAQNSQSASEQLVA